MTQKYQWRTFVWLNLKKENQNTVVLVKNRLKPINPTDRCIIIVMYSDSTVICRQKWKKKIFCFLIFTSKDSFDLVTRDGYRWFAVNFTCLNHTGCRGSNMANSCHSCRAWILMQLWFKWVLRKLILNCELQWKQTSRSNSAWISIENESEIDLLQCQTKMCFFRIVSK